MIDVNQLVNNILGTTMGTAGQDLVFRDTPAPMLPPEQQIRQEAEIQTPPRREPRRDESQRPKGPRLRMSGTALAPESFTDQDVEAAGRYRQNDEWSPVVALENTVLRMWENGSLREQLPNIGCDFPIYITGLEG